MEGKIAVKINHTTEIKYIIYIVQDYSILYNNAFRLVICEGGHFAQIK